MKFGVKADFKH